MSTPSEFAAVHRGCIFTSGGHIYIHVSLSVAPCGALWLLQPNCGLLSLFVAHCGLMPRTCGYLSPSTLTMPLNYIAVSLDLKHVQKHFCYSPLGCLASELLGRV